MRNYFLFFPDSGGMIDSRELMLHIEHLPDIQRATERVEKITVPGRSGTLTRKEGETVFDSYTKTFDIVALDESKIPKIHALLRGTGKIIFSNEPQFRYTVSFDIGWSFNRFFRQWRRATLSLETQPFKESSELKKYTKTDITEDIYGGSSGISLTINCETEIPCPFIVRFKSGDFYGYNHMQFNKERRVTFKSIYIRDPSATEGIVDNERGLIYTDTGVNLLDYGRIGSFPFALEQGANLVEMTDVTKMSVEYRGWFL